MKESMAAYPSHLDLDVVGFGNALVDVLSHQDEEFIERIGAIKGGMNLVDGHRSAELYQLVGERTTCLLYTSPSPRDKRQSRMPSSA